MSIDHIKTTGALQSLSEMHAEHGMADEFATCVKAAKHYEAMQRRYPAGHPKRRAAHKEWIAAVDALYPDEA